MNEQQLIEKCKQNDYSAQITVYNNYKNMMLNVSFRIVQSREDAEDLMQEAFIKGFQKMHQLKENMSLGAWLKRIVVNKSLDFVRKKKKETWLEETYRKEDSTEENEEVDNGVSIAMIKDCINQLKEKYRIVLLLYLIENYNHREIGEMLELKESTVRNQYSRGRVQLAQLLKEYTNGSKKVYSGT